MNRDPYKRGDKLFVISGAEGTTAHNYVESLKNMISHKHEEIIVYGTNLFKEKHMDFEEVQEQ